MSIFRLMDTEIIIKAIEAAAAKHGLSPATITRKAVENGRLYGRLKDGKGCTVKVAGKILAFIDGLPSASATK